MTRVADGRVKPGHDMGGYGDDVGGIGDDEGGYGDDVGGYGDDEGRYGRDGEQSHFGGHQRDGEASRNPSIIPATVVDRTSRVPPRR